MEPIGKLQQKIDRYSKQFNDKTVSIHIRSWNRNGEKGRRDYLYNIEKFEKEEKRIMSKFEKQEKEMIEKFKKKKKGN